MKQSMLAHIADRVLNRPLMILPDKLSLIASVLDGRIGIDAADLDENVPEALKQPGASRFVGEYELVDPSNPRSRKAYRTTKSGVAVISVLGSLVNRGAWVGSYSGMTSYEGLRHQISSAAADEDVSAIVLDIDSPGGEAVGCFEVAETIRAALAQKPVQAVVNGMACSAAYAIASACRDVITTASGISGSIGVVMLHADYSNRLHQAGVVPTLIHAGARKVDGNPYKPLTDDVRAELKSEIERFMDLFVSSVAQGRLGMNEDAIRATEARTYIGADAVKVGLADRVGSFEAVVEQLSTSGASRSSTANTRGNRMAKENEPAAAGITQAQLDEAVKTAKATGMTDGVKAERDRFKAVFGHDGYKGREASAHHMLLTTDMTAEAITGVLAGLPAPAAAAAPQPPQQRASDAPGGLVVDPAASQQKPASADNHGWDDVVAGLNKSTPK